MTLNRPSHILSTGLVDACSAGCIGVGGHPVMYSTSQVARSMGVPLVPRRARVFDEINDIVGCDLVLVMDSFDATEVRQRQVTQHSNRWLCREDHSA